jgi:hypothetical protein
MTTRLLVSVRTPSEARLAWVWGASLIDVKEPSRGPLGRAADATIAAVADEAEGHCPVSAAMGELRDDLPLPWGWERLDYLKWGLAGCAGHRWPALLSRRAERVGSRAVVVAYADAARAGSPPVAEVVEFAANAAWPDRVLLIDTFDKTVPPSGRRPTLLDWMPPAELSEVCGCCHEVGVRVALAGSLGVAEVRRLIELSPDWIGVRGAVCLGGERAHEINANAVRNLAELLRTAG